MMKRAIAGLCVLLEMLPAIAIAEKPECNPDWPTRCAAAVKAGEKAPFTGQLMTDDLAIFLGQSTDACAERTRIEVTRTASIAEADRVRDAKIAQADLRVAETERDIYKRESERSFMEQPVVVAGITAVVMVLLYVAANGVVRAGREIQQ